MENSSEYYNPKQADTVLIRTLCPLGVLLYLLLLWEKNIY